MTLRNFVPLAVLILAAFGAAAYYTSVPPAPVMIIAFFALAILAFQVEDGKLADIFKEIADAFHKAREPHIH